MKHKFKPSIGGNRGKKGVPGGGKREKETPHADKTAGPSLESTADHVSSFDVRTSLNESSEAVPATHPRAVTADVTEHREERQRTDDDREAGESRAGVEGEPSVVEVRKKGEVQPNAKTVPASSVGRLKRRATPTVVSGRPRRPSKNCNKPLHEQNTSVSTCSSEGTSHTSGSGGDVAVNAQSSTLRAAVEYIDHPTTHHLGQRLTENVGEETGREEVVSVTPGPVLKSQLEDFRESCTDDNNLSGMVRSSLDLVCPPPISTEGATFELSSQERRLSPAYNSDEETVVQDGGSLDDPPESGCVEGGEGEAELDHRTTREEPQHEKVSSRTTCRSRKRQSTQSDQTETTSEMTKKRRTGSSSTLRSPTKVRKAPNRASMTMQELIYYNPSANPMSSSVEEKKRKSQQTTVCSVEANDSSSRVSTPAPAGSDVSSEVSSDAWGDSQESGRIVPQLRMGKDGHIVLDEESMVVQATARQMAFDDPLNPPLLEGYGHTTSASYRKSSRVTRWTGEETTVFFRALSQVGTDFTMMTLLLPKRSRKELKNKFKKEEKSNPHRVSQALKSQTPVRPRTTEM